MEFVCRNNYSTETADFFFSHRRIRCDKYTYANVSLVTHFVHILYSDTHTHREQIQDLTQKCWSYYTDNKVDMKRETERGSRARLCLTGRVGVNEVKRTEGKGLQKGFVFVVFLFKYILFKYILELHSLIKKFLSFRDGGIGLFQLQASAGEQRRQS